MGRTMAPMKMKASKAKKVITKGETFSALQESTGVAKKDVKAVMASLQELAAKELGKAGKFTIPGITRVVLRQKPARKAGTRMAFGKEIKVKAQPARKVVRCYAVKMLKDNF